MHFQCEINIYIGENYNADANLVAIVHKELKEESLYLRYVIL